MLLYSPRVSRRVVRVDPKHHPILLKGFSQEKILHLESSREYDAESLFRSWKMPGRQDLPEKYAYMGTQLFVGSDPIRSFSLRGDGKLEVMNYDYRRYLADSNELSYLRVHLSRHQIEIIKLLSDARTNDRSPLSQLNRHQVESISQLTQSESDHYFADLLVRTRGSVLSHLPEPLREDRRLFLSSVQSYPDVIVDAPDAFKQDRDIAMSVCRHCPYPKSFLWIFSEEVRGDRELIKSVIRENSAHFRAAAALLKRDLGFVKECMRINSQIYTKLDASMKFHPEIELEFDTHVIMRRHQTYRSSLLIDHYI